MGVTTKPGLIDAAELPLPAAAMETMPVAPATASIAATAVPTEVVAPASAEGKVNLPNTTEAIKVSAVFTDAQIAAQVLREDLLKTIYAWYAKRPVLTTAWVEPTEDERNERISALMIERSIKPTNFIAIGQLAMEVTSQIDATRPNDDIAAQARRDRDYAIAALDVVLGLKDPVKAMGGLQSTTRKAAIPTAKGAGRPSNAERNQKLIAWCQEKGLGECVLVDRTSRGYKGTYHAIIPLPDGTYQRCDYDENTGAITKRDEIVPRMKWFDMEGSENMKRFYMLRMKTPSMFLKLAWLNGDEKGNYSSKGNLETLLKSLA